MLKPKHYPFVTMCGAVLMTVLPLLVFVLIGRSPHRDDELATGKRPGSRDIAINDLANASVDSIPTTPLSNDIAVTREPVVSAPVAAPTPFATFDQTEPAAVDDPVFPVIPDSNPAPIAQVGVADATTDADSTNDSVISGPGIDFANDWSFGQFDLAGRTASSENSSTKPDAAETVPRPEEDPDPVDVEESEEDEEKSAAAEKAAQEIRELGNAVLSETSAPDATGHLIEASRPMTTSKRSKSKTEAATETKPSDSGSVEKAEKRSPQSRRDRSRSKSKSKAKTASKETNGAPPAAPAKTAADGSPIVDILLRTPSEKRSVRRVEDIVAVTNETGWPIALVRSDLPDSRWWVQMVTGIKGNTFTSRVNFGNTETITGSKFLLVFVFLETQDEVRRFKIAKQFKDIPTGLRRTREYRFTRK